MADKNVVQSALEAGREQARKVIQNPHPGGRAFILLFNSDGMETLHYIDRPDNPPRRSGTVPVKDEASFLELWKMFSVPHKSLVYALQDPAQFIAVLNEHDSTRDVPEADWRDHRISFQVAASREWLAWNQHNGKFFESNDEFAEWLEDSIPDVVDPSGATLLEIALSMQVNSAQTIGKAVRLADGNINFQFANTVAGQAVAGGSSVKIPDRFTLEIPVFDGIDQPKYKMNVRLRFRAGAAIKVMYQLERPHKIIEQAFKELRDKIAAGTGQSVIFGKPEA